MLPIVIHRQGSKKLFCVSRDTNSVFSKARRWRTHDDNFVEQVFGLFQINGARRRIPPRPVAVCRRTLSRERELERTLGARGARSKNKTRSAQRLLSGVNRKT
jgi:hypothetical protein